MSLVLPSLFLAMTFGLAVTAGVTGGCATAATLALGAMVLR